MTKCTQPKALLRSNNERTTGYLLLNELKAWFKMSISAVVDSPGQNQNCDSDNMFCSSKTKSLQCISNSKTLENNGTVLVLPCNFQGATY